MIITDLHWVQENSLKKEKLLKKKKQKQGIFKQLISEIKLLTFITQKVGRKQGYFSITESVQITKVVRGLKIVNIRLNIPISSKDSLKPSKAMTQDISLNRKRKICIIYLQMINQKDIKKVDEILGQRKTQSLNEFKSPQVRKNFVQTDQNALNLSDLSPYLPLSACYHSASTYIRVSASSDMVFIETPANSFIRPSYMEQIDEGLRSISKIITWAHDEESSGKTDEIEQYQSQDFQFGANETKLIPSMNSIEQQKIVEPQSKISFQKGNQKKEFQNLLSSQTKSSNPPKRICNCKKTQCLKLYCDCFREGQTCQGCSCVGCHNTDEHQKQRSDAMITLIDRNPETFKPKIQSASHSKGCNCKKSNCQKKYCECYQAGLKCGKSCKCEDCKNCEHQDFQKGGLKTTKKYIPTYFRNKKIIMGCPTYFNSMIRMRK